MYNDTEVPSYVCILYTHKHIFRCIELCIKWCGWCLCRWRRRRHRCRCCRFHRISNTTHGWMSTKVFSRLLWTFCTHFCFAEYITNFKSTLQCLCVPPAWTTLSATVECDMHTPHTSVHKYKCRYIYRYTYEQTQDEMVKSHLWEGISTSAYAHSLCCVPRNFYIGLYLHRCVRSIGLGYSYRIFSVYCIAKRVVWMAIFSLSLGFVRSFLQLWVLYTYVYVNVCMHPRPK